MFHVILLKAILAIQTFKCVSMSKPIDILQIRYSHALSNGFHNSCDEEAYANYHKLQETCVTTTVFQNVPT